MILLIVVFVGFFSLHTCVSVLTTDGLASVVYCVMWNINIARKMRDTEVKARDTCMTNLNAQTLPYLVTLPVKTNTDWY